MKKAGPNTFGLEAKPSPHKCQKRQHYRQQQVGGFLLFVAINLGAVVGGTVSSVLSKLAFC
jgi:hypothetical protein